MMDSSNSGLINTGGVFSRTDELKKLFTLLRSRKHILIGGQKGIGKTAISKILLKELDSKGLMTGYVDCFGVTSIEDYLQRLTSGMLGSTVKQISDIANLFKTYFPQMAPKIQYESYQELNFQIDFQNSADHYQQLFKNFHEFPENIGRDRGKKVFIVIDNFHLIIKLIPLKWINKWSASLMEGKWGHAIIIFNNEYFARRKKYAFTQNFVPFNLEEIDEKKTVQTIKEIFNKNNIVIDSATLTRLVRFGKGHPYFTMRLITTIAEQLKHKGESGKKVIPEVITKTVGHIIRDNYYYYKHIWNYGSMVQMKILIGLTRSINASIYSIQFLNENDIGGPSSAQTAVRALLKGEIIMKRFNHYFISDPFFEEWIRREIL